MLWLIIALLAGIFVILLIFLLTRIGSDVGSAFAKWSKRGIVLTVVEVLMGCLLVAFVVCIIATKDVTMLAGIVSAAIVVGLLDLARRRS